MKDLKVLQRLLARLSGFVHSALTNMNLALIDPFQLAQDYPDALTNDLREYRVLLSQRNRH
jgi:hypothetical protein